MKTCFFIGHREAPESLAALLEEAVERHICQLGVTEFVVGSYGEFDRMAAGQLAAAKKRHPEINIMLLAPYHPSEHRLCLPRGFETVFYPPGMERVPKRFAIARANRYMIQHSDCVIAYVRYIASNSRELLEYARRLEAKGTLRVENLADKIENNC